MMPTTRDPDMELSSNGSPLFFKSLDEKRLILSISTILLPFSIMMSNRTSMRWLNILWAELV